ncbi:polyribonucleotide nucleotidyltransferase [Candidatus Saccharibacteria bacterium RIFCSPHIGHO2_12_FULL_41_12]|nr:MAG: polyribonucleotide nucleotidyltransferase [Candidatus Saccharibacteria bacterium RIFCSPHIGHO2_12_FULL_41_12]
MITVETEFCGRKLTLEYGRVGFRTSASVIVKYGDTVVLGTAMVKDQPAEGFDYFPMSIDYEEKMYAAGKISGSRFIKREGRPSDEAVLIGRLIDRPIRPLWPKGYRHEVQGVASVMSMDPEFRPDMIAMIAVSCALMLTGAPFEGPVAGVRVAQIDGKFVPFASREHLDNGALDLVVAGTSKGIMMVEAGANEVSEEVVAEALDAAFTAIQPAIELQKELIKKIGVKPQEYTLSLPDESFQKRVDAWVDGKLGDALRSPYPERNELIADLRTALLAEIEADDSEHYQEHKNTYKDAFTMALHKDARAGIVEKQLRPDGRKLDEIRSLSSEVGILPRTHGSSLFTRGLTQALNIVTLAPLSYVQLVDTMERSGERRFLHHYNAPGYTVGEIRRLGSAGRREIGHGYLAERALSAVLPPEAEFPYTIRSVTEIMSQNGSTSMAATCSSCLALMDAGVPIKRPVSGIAMGLMLGDDGTPYILSDIADAEDFAGDMDFKVTGTEKGITAIQMDMKVHGLGVDVLKTALLKGKEGRNFILQHMISVLGAPRDGISKFAPQVDKLQINPEKIREVIGKGGEIINKIIAESGAEIEIKDDGLVLISAVSRESMDKAMQMIRVITAEPEVGLIYEDCPVVSVLDFGAFVQIMPGKEGLVHVSEMAEERVSKTTDFIKEGDKVTVKLTGIDDRGRLQLSMKAAKRERDEKKS